MSTIDPQTARQTSAWPTEPCLHKAPAACLLTALPICCACQDVRQHFSSYRTYVDGIGFVHRGTRQQHYCWECQQFWNSRIHVSGIASSDVHLPDRPDISEYLRKWNDFQAGYMTVADGPHQGNRITLAFEPWSTVARGRLPSVTPPTREELIQYGGTHGLSLMSDTPDVETTRQRRRRRAQEEEQEPEHDINTFFDQLSLSDEEEAEEQERDDNEGEDDIVSNVATAGSPEGHSTALLRSSARPSGNPTSSQRDSSARLAERYERARERMTRVFGTVEDVQRDDYQSPVADMFNRHWERYRQVQQDRRLASDLNQQDTRNPAQAEETQSSAAQQSRTPARAVIAYFLEQFMAVKLLVDAYLTRVRFGIHDAEPLMRALRNNSTESGWDIVALYGDEDNSDTFTTSGEQVMALLRLLRDLATLNTEIIQYRAPPVEGSLSEPTTSEVPPTTTEPTDPSRTILLPRHSTQADPDTNEAQSFSPAEPTERILERIHDRMADYTNWQNHPPELDEVFSILESIQSRINELRPPTAHPDVSVHRDLIPTPPTTHLDNDASRPPPLPESELKIACGICYSQNADIACLPCGHMVMCEYCADVEMPVRSSDRTCPENREARCPMCRKKVRSRVRIRY